MHKNITLSVSDYILSIDDNGTLWKITTPIYPESSYFISVVASKGKVGDWALDADGCVWLVTDIPQRLTNLPTIQSISAQFSKVYLLDNEGQVWFSTAKHPTSTDFHKMVDLPAIAAISTSSHHSLFLDFEGCVWGLGSNQVGELGTEGSNCDFMAVNSPRKFLSLPPIEAIFAQWNVSVFLDFDGEIWHCGSNVSTQFGLVHRSFTPKKPFEGKLPPIKFASIAFAHSLYLDFEGYVWSCGSNQHGQLGLGDNRTRLTPVRLETLPTIELVSAGSSLSAFLDVDGFVWCCGAGYGEATLPRKLEGIPKIQKPGGPPIKKNARFT